MVGGEGEEGRRGGAQMGDMNVGINLQHKLSIVNSGNQNIEKNVHSSKLK